MFFGKNYHPFVTICDHPLVANATRMPANNFFAILAFFEASRNVRNPQCICAYLRISPLHWML